MSLESNESAPEPTAGKAGRPRGARSDKTAGLDGPNYSRAGAALYLGVSVSLLKNYATKGGGPSYCQTGKRAKTIYRKDDLDAWLASQVKRSTSDAV